MNIQFKKDNRIEAIIALKNPTKLALGTRKKASFSIIALITKENNVINYQFQNIVFIFYFITFINSCKITLNIYISVK